ncbi:PREDICTED: putative late blight resistance protein homolog R1B-8 [Erythranthe guttata]|uniref:putative late blight resistance protein homolog R1B-8 n=1 Tax=Erythranthe guttata TaxID=4155 RepID=UPI00064DBAAA|nr:PREDICTED: putative late blight resistance protein homolog R1B-8 [Erythranthe guttata]|eukprot:XP_012844378.1 PREDICTED: putative late blight resistance protein homolog R1B-8 [Erythranthe guttata]
MAAYAALLSLRHIIEQLQHHPFPPICLDQNQIQSLTDNLNFLQEFLEQGYPCVGSSKEALDVFESRIADAAHAAEDMIETRVVDQILAESTAQASKDITETWVCDQILGGSRKRKNTRMQDRLRRILSIFRGAGSSRSPSTRQNAVAGLDVVEKISSVDLYRDLDKVIQDMGLIKKDVMEIKDNNIGIEDHLHMNSSSLAGAASSSSHLTTKQETMVGFDGRYCKYESRKILSGKSEGELSERVHKSIWGRRYLIVLDDIWSVEVWDRVQIFFPDNGQGSRVMITTRLSNVVFQIIGSHGLVMDFLNEYKSWELLRKSIFEKQEDCPLELEEIGKKIAKNCKGLPLSIVVIGGLLAKSKPTREYWEYISENLNSILHLEENERCLKVLHLSYNHLPVHLKPCFLYMGVFPEDKNIRVSWLVKVWVCEDF